MTNKKILSAEQKLKNKERNKKWRENNLEKSKATQKAWYHANKEKVYACNQKWKETHPEEYKAMSRKSYHKKKTDPSNIKHYLWKNAKARAVQKKLEFSITEEDIILPEVCPILKTPFDKSTRRYSYSLDRKDPTKGYTPNNIWVVSQLANAMKWDSTEEERVLFAKWVLQC